MGSTSLKLQVRISDRWQESRARNLQSADSEGHALLIDLSQTVSPLLVLSWVMGLLKQLLDSSVADCQSSADAVTGYGAAPAAALLIDLSQTVSPLLVLS